jgi:hypothetical protein
MTRSSANGRIIGLSAALLFGAVGTANAVVCAAGVYRAGCAGPNGAVVAHRPAVHAPVCVNGVYRAGCVGPHGAAVVHKPVAVAPVAHCHYVNGVRVCR